MLQEKAFLLNELFSDIKKMSNNTDIDLFKRNSPDVITDVDSKIEEIKNFLEEKPDSAMKAIIQIQKIFRDLILLQNKDEEPDYNNVHSSLEKVIYENFRKSDIDYKTLVDCSNKIIVHFKNKSALKKLLESLTKKRNFFKKFASVSCIAVLLSSIFMSNISGLLLGLILLIGIPAFTYAIYKIKKITNYELLNISSYDRHHELMKQALFELMTKLGAGEISEFRYLAQQLFLNQEERIVFVKEAINDDSFFKMFNPLILFSENGMKEFIIRYEHYENRKNAVKKEMFKNDALNLIDNMNG